MTVHILTDSSHYPDGNQALIGSMLGIATVPWLSRQRINPLRTEATGRLLRSPITKVG